MNRLCRVALGVLLILALGARLAFFAVSVLRVPPVMDESITMLQAKCIVESKDSEAAQAKLYPRPPLGRFPLLFMTQPYLFPLESYLQAPWVWALPRNAFGARLLISGLGLGSVALALGILRRWGAARDVWPGLLLAAWPSAYLVMLQSAYAPPSYGSFLCLSALTLWLVQVRHDSAEAATWRSAALLGFVAGLACSGQLMAAPFLAVAALSVPTTGRPRRRLTAAAAFLMAAAAGLLPYWAGRWYHPGAHEAVAMRYPWRTALARLWVPTLTFTLPSAMGIRCPRFPDGESAIALAPGLDAVFPWIWLAVMGLASVRVLRRWMRARWVLSPPDLAVALNGMALALFAVNRRAESHSFRYLASVAWLFPLVIGDLYRQAGRRLRAVVAAAAVALAGFNAATLFTLLRHWSQPGFAVEEARLYDLKPAIRCLDARGIRHAVGSYFDAYRLTYQTDERILCAQHYNDRFYDWPLPYKAAVDASPRVAYVLGPAYRFTHRDFEADLATMGVTGSVERCGEVFVYSDFQWQPPCPEHRLAPGDWEPASDAQPADAGYLRDGNPRTRWRSRGAQQPGMGIELRFRQALPICRLTFYYDGYPYDRARALRVLARQDQAWDVVLPAVPEGMDRFEFLNDHPVYGSQAQTIRFQPVVTSALRVEIAEPNPGRDWTIGEIAVFSSEPSGP